MILRLVSSGQSLMVYKGTASSEGYSIDGTPLNLSEKDQKWLGIKDTFKFEV